MSQKIKPRGPQESQAAAKRGRGGRQIGAQNFSIADRNALLDVIEAVQPLMGQGGDLWRLVASRYNNDYAKPAQRVERNGASLKRQWQSMITYQKPTGDRNCPEHIRRAKRIYNTMVNSNNTNARAEDEGEADEETGEDEEEEEEGDAGAEGKPVSPAPAAEPLAAVKPPTRTPTRSTPNPAGRISSVPKKLATATASSTTELKELKAALMASIDSPRTRDMDEGRGVPLYMLQMQVIDLQAQLRRKDDELRRKDDKIDRLEREVSQLRDAKQALEMRALLLEMQQRQFGGGGGFGSTFGGGLASGIGGSVVGGIGSRTEEGVRQDNTETGAKRRRVADEADEEDS